MNYFSLGNAGMNFVEMTTTSNKLYECDSWLDSNQAAHADHSIAGGQDWWSNFYYNKSLSDKGNQ